MKHNLGDRVQSENEPSLLPQLIVLSDDDDDEIPRGWFIRLFFFFIYFTNSFHAVVEPHELVVVKMGSSPSPNKTITKPDALKRQVDVVELMSPPPAPVLPGTRTVQPLNTPSTMRRKLHFDQGLCCRRVLANINMSADLFHLTVFVIFSPTQFRHRQVYLHACWRTRKRLQLMETRPSTLVPCN